MYCVLEKLFCCVFSYINGFLALQRDQLVLLLTFLLSTIKHLPTTAERMHFTPRNESIESVVTTNVRFPVVWSASATSFLLAWYFFVDLKITI